MWWNFLNNKPSQTYSFSMILPLGRRISVLLADVGCMYTVIAMSIIVVGIIIAHVLSRIAMGPGLFDFWKVDHMSLN